MMRSRGDSVGQAVSPGRGRGARFEGKVALVTGAGSGIGRTTAIAFAREAARVVVVDNRREACEETAEMIRRSGGAALALQVDVSDSGQVAAMIARAVEEFGTVHILHNNAGIAFRHVVAEQNEEEWDRCVSVNLRGTYLCARYAVPAMRKTGGSIINTSSVTGIFGVRNRAVYSATKAAIVALTKNMALDYARCAIRVNAVCPGFTRTPLIEPLLADRERMNKLLAAHPLGRLGTPEDIANGVLFLASDEASWITGQTLVIDGGFSVGCPVDI